MTSMIKLKCLRRMCDGSRTGRVFYMHHVQTVVQWAACRNRRERAICLLVNMLGALDLLLRHTHTHVHARSERGTDVCVLSACVWTDRHQVQPLFCLPLFSLSMKLLFSFSPLLLFSSQRKIFIAQRLLIHSSGDLMELASEVST